MTDEKGDDVNFPECNLFTKKIFAQVDDYLTECTATEGHKPATMSVLTYEAIKRLAFETGCPDRAAKVLGEIASIAFNDIFDVTVKTRAAVEKVEKEEAKH